MATPLPTTRILAFRAPTVKGSEVILPVMAHGELCGLVATASLWRQICAALQAPCNPMPAHNTVPDSATTPEGRKCTAAWAEQLAHPEIPQQEIARRHGLRVDVFNRWCNVYHRGELRETRRRLGLSLAPRFQPTGDARVPVLKPGGQLL